MNTELLMQFLTNKSEALKAKMEVVKNTGQLDLHEVFSKEWAETQISIHHLETALRHVHYYTNNEVRDKLKKYILEEVPDFRGFFRSDSIELALTAAIEKAFNRLCDEHFKDRIVNIIEGDGTN
jgi:hypothetical protein